MSSFGAAFGEEQRDGVEEVDQRPDLLVDGAKDVRANPACEKNDGKKSIVIELVSSKAMIILITFLLLLSFISKLPA